MRKKNGYAMILVICIMALLSALCLALLLSTSVVLSASRKQLDAEQCRILAASLSRELEEKLTSTDYRFENYEDEQLAEDESLWFYVKHQISSGRWPSYSEESYSSQYARRTFHFNKQPEVLGVEGEAEVVLWWASAGESEPNGATLMVQVNCTYKDNSATVLSEYGLEISNINYVNNVTTISYQCWQWSLNGRQ